MTITSVSRDLSDYTHICMLIYLLAGCEATGIPTPDVFWSMGVDNEPIQGTEWEFVFVTSWIKN